MPVVFVVCSAKKEYAMTNFMKSDGLKRDMSKPHKRAANGHEARV